jgi:hypothetical protein
MEQFLHSNEFMFTLASIVLAGGFYAFRKQIIIASKAAGKAAGLFLKRFGLNDEVEQVGQAFVDGIKETEVKQDEANVYSQNMPKPEATDPDPNSNECPSSTENKSNGE